VVNYLPSVVPRSPDRASLADRRPPLGARSGDLRSDQVAWSGDHATTSEPP